MADPEGRTRVVGTSGEGQEASDPNRVDDDRRVAEMAGQSKMMSYVGPNRATSLGRPEPGLSICGVHGHDPLRRPTEPRPIAERKCGSAILNKTLNGFGVVFGLLEARVAFGGFVSTVHSVGLEVVGRVKCTEP